MADQDHPIYDNAFSLEDNTYNLVRGYGTYFSKQTFPLTKRFKYFEQTPSLQANSMNGFIVVPYPLDPAVTNYALLKQYNPYYRVHAALDVTYQSKGSIGEAAGFRPSFLLRTGGTSVIEKRAYDYPGYSSLGISTAPTRIGVAFNNERIIFYYIYSSSNYKSIYFDNIDTMPNVDMKICFTRFMIENSDTNPNPLTIYLDKSQWMINTQYDEVGMVYPSTEGNLKQY